MLAYLFWHEPQPEVDAEAYVGLLQGFHHALAAAPPPSFVRSWSVRLDVAPWDAGPAGRPFEDWDLVEDWAALGTLNEGAAGGRARRDRGTRDDRRRRPLPAAARDARRAGAVDRLGRQAARRALRDVRAGAARRGRRGGWRRGPAPPDGARPGAGVRAPGRKGAGAAVAGGGERRPPPRAPPRRAPRDPAGRAVRHRDKRLRRIAKADPCRDEPVGA